MTDADLDDMCRLRGDAEVMRYYPRAKSRNEVQRWINWSKDNYATHGFGLWVIEHRTTGDFIGDCGLTWQNVDGQEVLEVGYHVLPERQGQGLATEGASACLRHGFETLDATMVTAIINPDNMASRRVAERIGMTVWKSTHDPSGAPIVVYSSRGHEA